MSKQKPPPGLSRRERQIMDAIYSQGSATAAEVRLALPDPPSDSAVRTLLRILETKGHLGHATDGPRYVYFATVPREKAQRGALRRVLDTFFDGSVEGAVAALLDLESAELSDPELARLSELVEQARNRGGE